MIRSAYTTYRLTIILLATALVAVAVSHYCLRRQFTQQEERLRALKEQTEVQSATEKALLDQIKEMQSENAALKVHRGVEEGYMIQEPSGTVRIDWVMRK